MNCRVLIVEYRVQADNYELLYLPLSVLLERIASQLGASGCPERVMQYSGQLPLDDVFEQMDAHIGARVQLSALREELAAQAALFREVEKRLLQVVKEGRTTRHEPQVDDVDRPADSVGTPDTAGLQGLDTLLESSFSQVSPLTSLHI